MKAELIAPCGMNCNVCRAVLDKSGKVKQCTGCRPRGKGCLYYGGMCEMLREEEIRFCHTCGDFPCEKLKQLDKRYRTGYEYGFIEALEFIRDKGMRAHLAKEKKLWKCPECGGLVCIHDRKCYGCGKGGKTKSKR
ncbi:MAG: DUF3795 domain-containing protein [Methanobacteriota archaeon]